MVNLCRFSTCTTEVFLCLCESQTKKSRRISDLEVQVSSLPQLSVHGTVYIKFYPSGVDINLFYSHKLVSIFASVSAWMNFVVHSCL